MTELTCGNNCSHHSSDKDCQRQLLLSALVSLIAERSGELSIGLNLTDEFEIYNLLSNLEGRLADHVSLALRFMADAMKLVGVGD